MRDTLYLSANKRGVTRMTKNLPARKSGEVAVKISVEIDDVHFKSPLASAHIVVGDDHLIDLDVDVEIEDPDLPNALDFPEGEGGGDAEDE